MSAGDRVAGADITPKGAAFPGATLVGVTCVDAVQLLHRRAEQGERLRHLEGAACCDREIDSFSATTRVASRLFSPLFLVPVPDVSELRRSETLCGAYVGVWLSVRLATP